MLVFVLTFIFAEPIAVASVQQFLERIDLQQYFEVFRSNGFDKADTLKYLDLSALKDMRVALGHQGKLLDHAKRTTFNV
jgi:ABC-type sulfate transport system permease component